ncbi:MAG: hypothetical protein K6G22_11215 [Lachnospiraceae bacterium]|nr:hypothetical protein [Lachnospiraceae bacterium]
MKKVAVLYDDRRIPDREIKSITGNRSFGQTIYKRVSLKDRMIKKLGSFKNVSEIYVADEENGDIRDVLKSGTKEDTALFRIFSDFLIEDSDEISVLLQKACYIKEIYRVMQGERVVCIMYPCIPDLLNEDEASVNTYEKIEGKGFIDLSDVNNFRQFITSGFDARFFNSLKGDRYTVVKHSSNRDKLRAEYRYYGFLPEQMRMWYALPFDYKEDENGASYSMERFFVADVALRYVHGAMDTAEFKMLLDKLFYFIKNRKSKEYPLEYCKGSAKRLYVDKVLQRLSDLKAMDGFEKLETFIKTGTGYSSIDEIKDRYLRLYEKLESRRHYDACLYAAHGDLCFSNILYNSDMDLLKLIDPKGAETEDELYMDPYYDVCKLSHSVLGEYDYFNSDLFEITLNDDLRFRLVIDDGGNERFKDIFKEYLHSYDMDYDLVRIYEASLFLSMLPLHMDREKKVFGFILNALRIMDELEE